MAPKMPPHHLALLAIPALAAAVTFTIKTLAKTDADAYAQQHAQKNHEARRKARAALDAADRGRKELRKEFREWYGYEYEGLGAPPEGVMEALREEKERRRAGYEAGYGYESRGYMLEGGSGSSRASSESGGYDPRDYAVGGVYYGR